MASATEVITAILEALSTLERDRPGEGAMPTLSDLGHVLPSTEMVERAFQPLTREERAILDFLLHDKVPDVDALRLQAAAAKARSSCDCGCPSIAFEVDRAQAPRAASWDHSDLPYHVVEASSLPGTSSHPSLLLLFVENGWLHEVELTDLDGDGSVPIFPPPDEFEKSALSH